MKVVLLAFMILFWVKPQKEQKLKIEKASAYESFYKAGTSKLLLNVLADPMRYGVEKPRLKWEKRTLFFCSNF